MNEFTIGKLIQILAVENDISNDRLAKELEVNRVTVWRFLNHQTTTGASSNQWIERIDAYMQAIGVNYQFLDAKKRVFEIPNTITTIGQLFRKLGKVYIKLSDGREFRIIQHEEATV